MNRALFSGLSGTMAFQERLDVVGNNIANSNTVGFKEGRVTFQDALYQTLEGGRSGGELGIGGTNPVQIGSGVSLSAAGAPVGSTTPSRAGQPSTRNPLPAATRVLVSSRPKAPARLKQVA